MCFTLNGDVKLDVKKLLAANLVIYKNIIINPPTKIKNKMRENQDEPNKIFITQHSIRVCRIRVNKATTGDSTIKKNDWI